jgi:4-oxalocrotonate tautomerase
MPIVHIDLLTGRPPERISALIREVSDAVAHALDAPVESVRIVVNEMQPHQYGVGGKPWPEVAEERRQAAQEPQADA